MYNGHVYSSKMGRISQIKSKWNSLKQNKPPKGLPMRILIGIVLIVFTNGVSLSSGIFQWVCLIILVTATPVLMVLDYRELWRDGLDDTGPLVILGRGEYQSIIAVTFSVQSLLTVGLSLESIGMLTAWVISVFTGFAVYPLIISGLLSYTSDLGIKTTPVRIEFQESASKIANIYLNRDWITFNEPLTSFREDQDFSEYSLIRYPVGEQSDISFMTKLPPKVETERDEFARELFQLTHNAPVPTENGCEMCYESDKDLYVRVAFRKKIKPYLYQFEPRYICESCMRQSVIEVAGADRIEDLTKADLIVNEI